jgi:putative Mg2+ transporter-C (MgtC) family protein
MSTLDTITLTLRTEFSDLLAADQLTRVILRLCVALLLGAAIGWERERRDAEAGLRTHMLVSLGAALFVLLPVEAGMGPEGVSRVMQGLVSGIGFLGAAAVLKVSTEGRIHGLTTAASIWATAAVGMAAGLGREGTAVLSTLLVLLVLAVLRGVGQGSEPRAQASDRSSPAHLAPPAPSPQAARPPGGSGRPDDLP